MKSYKDIVAYQKAYSLVLEIYKETRLFPDDEKYGLISQMRRASVSMPLNIAEGYSRRQNPQEFKRFLTISIGSCNEISVLLELCKDLGYVSQERYERLHAAYDECGKMLTSYSSKL